MFRTLWWKQNNHYLFFLNEINWGLFFFISCKQHSWRFFRQYMADITKHHRCMTQSKTGRRPYHDVPHIQNRRHYPRRHIPLQNHDQSIPLLYIHHTVYSSLGNIHLFRGSLERLCFRYFRIQHTGRLHYVSDLSTHCPSTLLPRYDFHSFLSW